MQRRMKRRVTAGGSQAQNNLTRKNPAQKMAKNMSVFAFVMCLVVIALIFGFYQYKNRDKTSTSTTTQTETQKLAEKDLDTNYPGTPAEVMKLYGRINQCMYNTELSDEDFDTLLQQLRKLYSTTLLEENTLEEQKSSLRDEINDFTENKRKIVSYTVEKNSSVDYETVDNQECAYVQIAFFMSENSKYLKSYQDYVLVKEDKNWKILAFKKDEDAGKETS